MAEFVRSSVNEDRHEPEALAEDPGDRSPTNVRARLLATYPTIALAFVTGLCFFCVDRTINPVFEHIEQTAWWLRGGPKPDVVTWPSWGYVLARAAVSRSTLLTLQLVVAIAALAMFTRRVARALPEHRRRVWTLSILAIPWHVNQVQLYPTGLAGSFSLLGLLALERSTASSRKRWSIAAGLLFGTSQSFRSEYVLLTLTLGCVVLIRFRRPSVRLSSLRVVALCTLTALAAQIPWTLFYRSQTNRFSLTESNLGHVLYLSLGSDPGNPWGIVPDDQFAAEVAGRAGYPSLSDAGSRYLLSETFRAVREHPIGLVGRSVAMARNTALAPFAWGQPRLDAESRRELDVLREDLKTRIRVAPNVRQAKDTRFDRQEARRNPKAVLALIYQLAATAFGSAFLFLALTGVLLKLRGRSMRADAPGLLTFAGVMLLYKVGQDLVLSYNPEYLSSSYPLAIPFAVVTLAAAAARLRRAP